MAGPARRGESIDALIGQIYDAAVDPAGWPRVLEVLIHGLRGTSGSFLWAKANAPEAALALWVNLDPEFPRLYNAHYHALDPWGLEARKRGLFRTGAAGVSEALCSTRELAMTEFGNDFAFPLGVVHGMTGIVAADATSVSAVSVYRDRPGEPFDDANVEPLRVVLPHLARAIEIHQRCSAIRQQQIALENAVNHVQRGVIFTDRRGKVVFLNRAAERMVAQRDGLRIRHGTLHAGVAAEHDRLLALIRAATEPVANPAHDCVTTVTRGSAKPPFSVLVSHVGQRSSPARLSFGAEAHADVVLFINDPDVHERAPATMLQRVFALTRAEARLAEALANGEALDEIAGRFALSIHTVRSQLKALFAKTETRRQAQLVRKLIAASRLPSG